METFNTYSEAVAAYRTSKGIHERGGVFYRVAEISPDECKPSDYLKPLSSMVDVLEVGHLYVSESDGIVREVNHPYLYRDNDFISDCYLLDLPPLKE